MILVATSGYAYNDWKGNFYPRNINKKEMLAFYAQKFPFTELNFTYYTMPNKFIFYNMLEKTPESFLFVVKAFGGITHKRDDLQNYSREFIDALEPMITSNRLACVLFQFPYSFRNTRKNTEYLKRIRENFGEIPLVVEFRSSDWIKESVIRFLKENEMGFVCVDEPRIKGLIPPVTAATSSIGYIRFHGRNAAKWYNHSKPYERYDYLYSKQELMEWVPRILQLEKQTEVVFVAMNNHFNAQAVINAKMLQDLLKK